MKSLKERRNHGSDPSLKEFSMKSSLAHQVVKLVLKVGWNSLSYCYPKKFEKILGSKIRFDNGYHHPNPKSTYIKLAWSTYPYKTSLNVGL